MVAGTSALSITALTLGLSAPAGAFPTTAPGSPQGVPTAVDELRESPIFDMIPGVTADRFPPVAAPQASAARMAAAITSSTPAVEEVARTETSATFRFTLPGGEVTRDDAVLQAYVPFQGYRLSVLSWLTDPAAGFGADHSLPFDDQLVALQVADLIRENFTITGATPTSRGLLDHFTVPAGQNSFEITISSARDREQLRDALRAITGIQPEDDGLDPLDWQAEFLLETRLSLPETAAESTWSYGERLFVMKSTGAATGYPNGANELSVIRTGTAFDSTLTISRADGTPFTGDRVLALGPEHLATGGLPMMGEIFEAFMTLYPPPLRPGTLTTEVTGATHVREGYYQPDPSTATVTARTTGTGPTTLAEARTRYTEWVTETCGADLADPIPGFPEGENGEVITWQKYIDEMGEEFFGPVGEAEPASLVYTATDYIDAVRDEREGQLEALFALYPGMDIEEIIAALGALSADWDAACGTTDGGDPDDGQAPAELTLDVPASGVAGSPLTLSATVTDNEGNPLVDREVTFTISEDDAGTLQMAVAGARFAPAANGATTLTAMTDADGVARVEYTPTSSGTLRISASTGGAEPVTSESDSTITVSPAPGGGDGDGDGGDDEDDAASGGGSLGSLFGSSGS